MKIETKRNIEDRLYKIVNDSISFFDIESIETTSLSADCTSVKYKLRVNMSAGYRTSVYEDELEKDYFDTPEEAAAALLEQFKNKDTSCEKK